MSSLVEAARSWAARGFVPMAARGKRPLAPGWQALDPADHLARIEAEPPSQIGLRMGRQSDGRILVAIDVDAGKGGEASVVGLIRELGPLPATLLQQTGGGGWHYIVEWPGSLAEHCPTTSTQKLAPGIDIRGERGHVVASPSLHESGRRYELVEDRSPALLPDRWVQRIITTHGKPAPAPDASRAEPASDAFARAQKYVSRMEPAISGSGGHRATWRVAQVVVRGFALGRADATRLLREYNARCEPPWSDKELSHKVESAEVHSRLAMGYMLEGRRDEWRGESWHEQWRAEWDAPPESAPKSTADKQTAPAEQQAGQTRTAARPASPAEERTDLGLARRLVRLYGLRLRYFGGRRCWLIWDGTRWTPDRTGEVVRKAKAAVESLFDDATDLPEQQRADARKWALSCQNQKRIGPMIMLAESEPGVPVTASDLDSDPWLLNTQSGILDLRTGQLDNPDPAKLMTKVCSAPYVPGARSELWDRFVADLFGDDLELRSYVQRAMGYALLGAWREKRFWFGYGPPDGGKSTFLGVVGDVLGDYHVSADASTWMVQHTGGGNRGDLTRLMGARLVSTLEVRASARFDQQLMKKITGGDTLTAAAKYEAEIEFSPTFSLWFGANDRPIIPDDDEGFWNRVACVPFTRVIPRERQDKALREKLTSREHAPAVLAWLAEGCLAWQRAGIGSCPAVEAAIDAYRRDANQAAGFFDECLRLTPGIHALCRDVSRAYGHWAKENNVRQPLTGKRLAQRLRQLGATGGDDESRVCGLRAWHGVELIDNRPQWGNAEDH